MYFVFLSPMLPHLNLQTGEYRMLHKIVIILLWNFQFGFMTYYHLHFMALLIMVPVIPVGIVTSFLHLIYSYGAWNCITNYCSDVVGFLILDLNGVLLQKLFYAN
jgi:hypothetical protein